jgi:hypothetical protein
MRRLDTPEYQFAVRNEARLRDLFERALREPRVGAQDSKSVVTLRDGVCSFVQSAKTEGRQVEMVIIALKAIFGIPDRPNRAFTDDDDTPTNIVLARRVVRWCIREYYGSKTDD